MKLREVPPQRMAVVKFSGLAGEDKVKAKTDELLAWMKAEGQGRVYLADKGKKVRALALQANEVIFVNGNDLLAFALPNLRNDDWLVFCDNEPRAVDPGGRGASACGALRTRLISRPLGCSRMATGSGPIGPTVLRNPSNA